VLADARVLSTAGGKCTSDLAPSELADRRTRVVIPLSATAADNELCERDLLKNELNLQ